MDPHVPAQNMRLGEAPSTVHTGERSYASVHRQVDVEVRPLSEALATQLTAVGPLTCVDALVPPQAIAQREAFATEAASMWTQAGVDHQVALQHVRMGKATPALWTHVWTSSRWAWWCQTCWHAPASHPSQGKGQVRRYLVKASR